MRIEGLAQHGIDPVIDAVIRVVLVPRLVTPTAMSGCRTSATATTGSLGTTKTR